MEPVNCVAKLNEYAQRTRSVLTYEDVGSVGPDHIKTFTIRVILNSKAYPDGVGKNKKEAKQNAAKNALKCLEEKPVDSTENAAEAPTAPVHQPTISDFNYIGWLNEYGHKNRVAIRAVVSSRPGPNYITQCCSFVVGDKEYPAATGKTKKEAKEEAAKLVYHEIYTTETTELSAVSDGAAPARLSTPPNTPESRDLESESVPTTTSDSVVFTNSTNPPKDQIRSPDVRPKIRLAANFLNAQSKEDMMANFNGKNTANTQSGKTTSKSVISIIFRFTLEFDSIVFLGKGGFGRVFKAKEKLLGKYCAIKIVRCKEKSLREVKILSDLHHVNILRYYTCWLEDSGYQGDISTDSSYSSSQSSIDDSLTKYLYIQMELCDTKTLRGWIDEKNAQSLQDSKRREESLHLAQQIISGVEYIHSKGLIHRDLKPANIMFGLDGKVKIGDFGLVTAENDDDDAENLMERTVYKGTRSYMAPEQKRERNYDRRVDIFALGLIYLELLWKVSTGHETVDVLKDARLQKFPKGFSLTFPQENQIIKAMLCEKPEGRPEASKLKAELEKWAQTANTQNLHHRNQTV
ncbi:interferon-induced, double-stranded RNA-activated protein kinase-like [Enoplosus armatus]|uniref:interferon-induced, double-stranded RNA-activated protein kinase-like n=1 Tax=Enoplosus armatus TaxID=215367 RepID=UPI003994DCC7